MNKQELYLRSVKDMFLPRFCSGCGQRLALGEELVCSECIATLPLEVNYNWEYNQRMNRWATHERLVRVGAFTRYEHDNSAAHIIRSLKYNRRYLLGPWMGRTAAQHLASSGLFDGVDALVPLPLTPARRRYRGFNQAELIAQGMSEVLGVPVLTKVLKRTADRESQTHFSLQGRLTNASHVFEVDEVEGLGQKHLMLVDDVMTTGTTMLGAIEALEAHTDVSISCFAWAWVTLSKSSMAASKVDKHT